MTPADARNTPPPCVKCARFDRMTFLAALTTDFGGQVWTWACRRDGIVAVLPLFPNEVIHDLGEQVHHAQS